MILRPGSLFKCCFVLLVALLPALAETAAGNKPKPKSAVTQSQKSGTARSKAGAGKAAGKTTAAKSHSSKGSSSKTISKKGRIPRTLRTIPVSPAVRESALTRVQANLETSATSPFTYPTMLRHFFAALAEQQKERGGGATDSVGQPALSNSNSKTVRILQYGDSHTAADIFTGEMRARLQQQFGDGGLGFQFPGHPFAGYHLAGSLRSQTTGWVTEGNRFTTLGDGDLGMGGISIETSQPEQSITLETTCTTMQLHFLQQEGGGRLQFLDNGVALSTVNTATEAGTGTNSAGTFAYSCTPGLHDFEFRTLDHAPVKLFGLVTEQPGATYECIGLNGAVAPLMLRWNPTLFNDYLRQRSPNLIVLAYGTNEAGSSAAHLDDYPTEFANILDNLHRVAPNASILVLGPPDRAMSSGRGRRASWHAFSGTDRIILMQKEACRLHGCTFWDTRRRMGGFGVMQQWVRAGWAQPDRTHLTGTGYRALADALYADLIRAYNLYEQHPETPVEESRNGKAPKNP
jgi:lysophospholipase L1-like esterase